MDMTIHNCIEFVFMD